MPVLDPSYMPTPRGGNASASMVNTGGDWWSQNAPSARTATPTASAPVSAPTGAAPAGAPPTGDFHDPNFVAQYVAYYANQPGANPSLARDPNYWIQKITSGELGTDPGYYVSKFMQPEGAPAGQGGSLSNLAPQDLSTGWTQAFTAPSAEDAMNSPGIQAALKLGSQAIQRSAAAKGTLLTGGTLKDLTSVANDLGSQAYGYVWSRAMAERQNAQQTFFGNQDRLFGRNLSLAQLGSGAADVGGNLATGAGNAQAAGQVGSANANIGALSGIANAGASAYQDYLQNKGAAPAPMSNIFNQSSYALGQPPPTNAY